MNPENRSNSHLHLLVWGKQEKKWTLSRQFQFILSSSETAFQVKDFQAKRNKINDATIIPSAPSPALPKQGCPTGCVLLLLCKSSGVSSAAKRREAWLKLPDALLRYFLLQQPCRFWRKAANSWRQQLLIFPLTFLPHSQTQILTLHEMAAT